MYNEENSGEGQEAPNSRWELRNEIVTKYDEDTSSKFSSGSDIYTAEFITADRALQDAVYSANEDNRASSVNYMPQGIARLGIIMVSRLAQVANKIDRRPVRV